jgi:hypothetical protein
MRYAKGHIPRAKSSEVPAAFFSNTVAAKVRSLSDACFQYLVFVTRVRGYVSSADIKRLEDHHPTWAKQKKSWSSIPLESLTPPNPRLGCHYQSNFIIQSWPDLLKNDDKFKVFGAEFAFQAVVMSVKKLLARAFPSSSNLNPDLVELVYVRCRYRVSIIIKSFLEYGKMFLSCSEVEGVRAFRIESRSSECAVGMTTKKPIDPAT